MTFCGTPGIYRRFCLNRCYSASLIKWFLLWGAPNYHLISNQSCFMATMEATNLTCEFRHSYFGLNWRETRIITPTLLTFGESLT
ncbi:uncharacterized protein LOC119658999 isoform X2 [Hermetia illucens]|uniref:uncharacterized protein LOC119658999 isoform X2 n=1 Tax=Hermetia illucens TaxID=343691 RepID=UPI0018CBF8C4|nr:uncharacterized protein LOC119658999 isoform X2 [Hermetia illucens]